MTVKTLKLNGRLVLPVPDQLNTSCYSRNRTITRYKNGNLKVQKIHSYRKKHPKHQRHCNVKITHYFTINDHRVSHTKWIKSHKIVKI